MVSQALSPSHVEKPWLAVLLPWLCFSCVNERRHTLKGDRLHDVWTSTVILDFCCRDRRRLSYVGIVGGLELWTYAARFNYRKRERSFFFFSFKLKGCHQKLQYGEKG